MNPERLLGANGKAYLRLPITNRPDRFAHIDAADHDRLAQGRRSLSLFVMTNGQGREYLAVKTDRLRIVARLLMDPGPKRTVTYLNGDRADCRRANLRAVAKKPGGKRKAPAIT